ncbi:MAG TPA: hypothetical protein VMS35_02110 [Nitrososphaeraceae archaeon]|nr:hypothetical protein [Nitrososphaeraceae archaeon]
MKTTLNDRQQIVLECMYRNLSYEKSLLYLKEQGFESSESTLKRDKNFIKKNSLLRLYQLAKVDYRSFHQERMEKIKVIESLMWKDIEDCKDPYKKAKIREMIANLQPIVSAYEDTARYVLEKSDSNTKQIQALSI